MASPDSTVGSEVGQVIKGSGVRCQELVRKGPQVPILDANGTCSNHTDRDAQHTQTHTECSHTHTLSPQPRLSLGDTVSWAGDREKTRPLRGYTISPRASLRGWAESTQDPQQLPQTRLKLAQLHSSANLHNLAGGCLSNRQPQFGKAG